ncbi:MAG: efflux RND transporter periplasmic adaptor subunit [Bacteroidales bacterium]|nr:efflux RND transporter periplasmic adaptor subunit [Bacteroidales bacterium]
MKTISTMKTIKLVLLTAFAGAALTACNMKPPGAAGNEATAAVEKRVQPVKVMDLVYSEIAIEQHSTSTVVAFEETYLSPALQGRIRSIKVEINDHVKKGDLLVELDRTQLDQTQLQYQQLKTDLARMDTLLRYGSITQQAYDQMGAQVETTALVLKNLEENTLLRAPYSGIITGKYFNDGELFSPAPNTPAGKAALISMMQVDPVKLMVNLSEKYLPLVKEGMTATITTDVYADEKKSGKVFRIHPTVSAATRTFVVEVKVHNKNEKLKPGMFARVSLKLGETEALIVPAIAVMQQSGTNERYVMLHENGTAKKVTVQIINRHDDQLEISSLEIKGGEQLIYAGQTKLEDGAMVNVVAD